jgi:formate dehydrogenase subunit delta
MANQIAIFFHSYPDDRAVDGVEKHLKKFWSPLMRKNLHAEAQAHPAELDDLVRDVLARDQQTAGQAA